MSILLMNKWLSWNLTGRDSSVTSGNMQIRVKLTATCKNKVVDSVCVSPPAASGCQAPPPTQTALHSVLQRIHPKENAVLSQPFKSTDTEQDQIVPTDDWPVKIKAPYVPVFGPCTLLGHKYKREGAVLSVKHPKCPLDTVFTGQQQPQMSQENFCLFCSHTPAFLTTSSN